MAHILTKYISVPITIFPVSMPECPDLYYENCANAIKSCHFCCAKTGSAKHKLHYSPLDASLSPHPYLQDTTTSKRVKRALKEEKKAKDDLIKATLRSGAIYGDGDYELLRGLLRADHKHRQKPCKSFALTLPEYEKGKSQGVGVWVITIHPEPNRTERGIFLTEQAFTTLLAAANLHLTDKSNDVRPS